jgi:hypothetical protein
LVVAAVVAFYALSAQGGLVQWAALLGCLLLAVAVRVIGEDFIKTPW